MTGIYLITFLQVGIKAKNVNYIDVWDECVAKHGASVFLEKGTTKHTYDEVSQQQVSTLSSTPYTLISTPAVLPPLLATPSCPPHRTSSLHPAVLPTLLQHF